MHGEKHVGNATYLNIQALFAANSDFYQTNWHSWLDEGNQILCVQRKRKSKSALKYHTGPGAFFHLHTF